MTPKHTNINAQVESFSVIKGKHNARHWDGYGLVYARVAHLSSIIIFIHQRGFEFRYVLQL